MRMQEGIGHMEDVTGNNAENSPFADKEIRFAVVDDSKMQRNRLTHYLETLYPHSMVNAYADISDIPSFEDVDILFADIELGRGRSGLDEVKKLIPADSNVQVIYVTGHARYISSSYDTPHIGFLLKPIDVNELARAVTRACKATDRQKDKPFTLWLGKTIVMIKPACVMYVLHRGRKCHVYNNDGTVIDVYLRLDDMEKNYFPQRFIRCHKSNLINPDYVVTFTGESFIMADDATIKASKSCRKEAEAKYRRYIEENSARNLPLPFLPGQGDDEGDNPNEQGRSCEGTSGDEEE